MRIEQHSRVLDWSKPRTPAQPRWALPAAGLVTAMLLAALGAGQRHLHRSIEQPQRVVVLDRVVITAARAEVAAGASFAASAAISPSMLR